MMIEASTPMKDEALRRVAIRHAWGARTHRGNVRATNQDSLVVEPELGLYAVLDGMGGAASGDVASRLAAEQLVDFVRQNYLGRQHLPLRDLLESAIDAAAAAVFDLAASDASHHGMGTTVVACLFGHTGQVLVAHAGDSRAYLLRNRDMRQLTRDHTIWQMYIEEGRVLCEGERFLKAMLTRNLGEVRGVMPDVLEQALEAGDRLLLCSDGLHEAVPVEVMVEILGSTHAPADIAQQLIDTALSGACSDNVSALVIATDASE